MSFKVTTLNHMFPSTTAGVLTEADLLSLRTLPAWRWSPPVAAGVHLLAEIHGNAKLFCTHRYAWQTEGQTSYGTASEAAATAASGLAAPPTTTSSSASRSASMALSTTSSSTGVIAPSSAAATAASPPAQSKSTGAPKRCFTIVAKGGGEDTTVFEVSCPQEALLGPNKTVAFTARVEQSYTIRQLVNSGTLYGSTLTALLIVEGRVHCDVLELLKAPSSTVHTAGPSKLSGKRGSSAATSPYSPDSAAASSDDDSGSDEGQQPQSSSSSKRRKSISTSKTQSLTSRLVRLADIPTQDQVYYVHSVKVWPGCPSAVFRVLYGGIRGVVGVRTVLLPEEVKSEPEAWRQVLLVDRARFIVAFVRTQRNTATASELLEGVHRMVLPYAYCQLLRARLAKELRKHHDVADSSPDKVNAFTMLEREIQVWDDLLNEADLLGSGSGSRTGGEGRDDNSFGYSRRDTLDEVWRWTLVNGDAERDLDHPDAKVQRAAAARLDRARQTDFEESEHVAVYETYCRACQPQQPVKKAGKGKAASVPNTSSTTSSAAASTTKKRKVTKKNDSPLGPVRQAGQPLVASG